MNRFVISVLVADRVGILRDITGALADMGAYIDGISQTVVAGYFTVILTARFDEETSPEAIGSAIRERFAGNEGTVVVEPYLLKDTLRPTVAGDRYIVTLAGEGRKGILKAVTAFLAERGINVEDWFVEHHPGGVTHVGEITVPKTLDIKHLNDEFAQLASGMGLRTSVQHENIFRATNEVGPVKHMLEEEPGA